MKKILSSVLCLAMILSMGVTAFADTNDFVLTYSNEASYEITIPPTGDIDVDNGKGVINISISDANLDDGMAVSVTATSENYSNGTWYLVNVNDPSDKIAYTIGTTDGGSDVANGDEIVSTEGDTSASFYITINDTNKIGTFTDTITFTSEIVTLISFTIDGDVFQAEEGMTWGEWVNSRFNNEDFKVNADYKIKDGSNTLRYSSSVEVKSNETIISNNAYQFISDDY